MDNYTLIASDSNTISKQLAEMLQSKIKEQVIQELQMISTKFVIEIGKDGDEDYQNEISLHDTLERIEQLKQEQNDTEKS